MRELAVLGATAREYGRTPVLLALLVGLPAYFVGFVGHVTPDTPIPLVLEGTTHTLALSDAYAALLTPAAAALVAGITGLFLMESVEVDGRLVVVGYRPRELLLARFGLLAGVALVGTAVAVAVLATAHTPEAVGWFAGGTLLVALTYGLVGVLAGTALDRLPGTYLLLFGPSLDLFVLQNPTADPPAWAAWLPGHAGAELAIDAAFTGSVDAAPLVPGVAYLAVLFVLAALVVRRRLA